MKALFYFLVISGMLGGYLVYTGKIDFEIAKEVVQGVDDYGEAMVNSVSDAQATADQLNARNAALQAEIEASTK